MDGKLPYGGNMRHEVFPQFVMDHRVDSVVRINAFPHISPYTLLLAVVLSNPL
jgi:hypothetical protein